MPQFSDNLEQARDAADRLIRFCKTINADPPDRRTLVMDLCAADGCNGNPPIDWRAMLDGPDGDLIHDVSGIHRFIDRSTGRLSEGFVPRCADCPPENVYDS